ncbi:OmpA family protein [Mucilaginibacter polytrichastri]|uniref:Outer membrane protein A n=1 Tax=Mucilaginibacter polytrichastri TaxID=1302689 RepID=A0A1Q5ZUC3_9SPHI|nr:OmpA family protein [Mucilaginibacter polytrichastri]OKS85365.1 Outer membrane protein A [Mucilaginibacter polytrichastri]SFS40053.1 OmpA-OmpF porin, OOP family [Mucilaginibacter polytrichastri]
MKFLKSNLLLVLAASLAFTLPACKAKKAVVKQEPVTDTVKTAPPAAAPAPTPAPEKQEPAPAPEKQDLNFANIQFEFNSAVLKTDSYQTLDLVATSLRRASTTKLVLNGNSSAEGSTAHNMSLSLDRANSVKAYLVNAGVNGDNLTTKGYGESKPIADNTTEEGRALNRRVEIKVVQ